MHIHRTSLRSGSQYRNRIIPHKGSECELHTIPSRLLNINSVYVAWTSRACFIGLEQWFSTFLVKRNPYKDSIILWNPSQKSFQLAETKGTNVVIKFQVLILTDTKEKTSTVNIFMKSMQTFFKNKDFSSSNDNKNKVREKSYIDWAASTKLENTVLNHNSRQTGFVKSMWIKIQQMQQYADIYLLQSYSICFGCHSTHHPEYITYTILNTFSPFCRTTEIQKILFGFPVNRSRGPRRFLKHFPWQAASRKGRNRRPPRVT